MHGMLAAQDHAHCAGSVCDGFNLSVFFPLLYLCVKASVAGFFVHKTVYLCQLNLRCPPPFYGL